MQNCLNAFGFDSKSSKYSKLNESQNLGQVNLGKGKDNLELILELSDGNGSMSLSLTTTGLKIVYSKLNSKPIKSILLPYLHILSTNIISSASTSETKATTLSINALISTKSGLKLWYITGIVTELIENRLSADEERNLKIWSENLEKRAYATGTKSRRLRVLVNPFGGKGKAKHVWENVVEPIFIAANCPYIVDYTGPSDSNKNATTIAQSLDLSSVDVIVCVSGDGIIHEFLNGLASRPDALKALRTPICPVAAGSGNALAVNLFGPEKCLDYAYNALIVIKGVQLPFDLCSISQGKEISWAFLAQAFGVMADLDLGTEHLRWMGDNRFTVGYIQAILALRQYPIEISLKIVSSSKESMANSYNAALKQPLPPLDEIDLDVEGVDLSMPSLKYGTVNDELPESKVVGIEEGFPQDLEAGWWKFSAPVQSLYAGKLPYVSRDAKMFPPARDDGLIDIALMEPTSRLVALSLLDGIETGAVFRNKHTKYYKCEVYRITPGSTKGYIGIDGESFKVLPYQVECHRKIARTLSLEGRWYEEEVRLS